MKPSKVMLVVVATIPILLAACSAANGERAPNTEVPKGASRVVPVEEDVLHSPAELKTRMGQVRRQIVGKTKKIPEPQYEQLVRPSLADQLRMAGFDEDDVDTILSEVDYSRRLLGRR